MIGSFPVKFGNLLHMTERLFLFSAVIFGQIRSVTENVHLYVSFVLFTEITKENHMCFHSKAFECIHFY